MGCRHRELGGFQCFLGMDISWYGYLIWPLDGGHLDFCLLFCYFDLSGCEAAE